MLRPRRSLGEAGDPDAIARHLDGIEAIIESNFAFEERKLAGVLHAMTLDADPADVLGRGGPAS